MTQDIGKTGFPGVSADKRLDDNMQKVIRDEVYRPLLEQLRAAKLNRANMEDLAEELDRKYGDVCEQMDYLKQLGIAGWFSTDDSAYAYLTETGRVLLGD